MLSKKHLIHCITMYEDCNYIFWKYISVSYLIRDEYDFSIYDSVTRQYDRDKIKRLCK